jgi:hypothetical protein
VPFGSGLTRCLGRFGPLELSLAALCPGELGLGAPGLGEPCLLGRLVLTAAVPFGQSSWPGRSVIPTVAAQVTVGWIRPVLLTVTESHATNRLGDR